MPIQLTVVVPTYNERGNVSELVRRLDTSLDGLAWEVIFVDDASPDGTSEAVRELARVDRRIRLIARHNRRGLSSAVVEGALAGAAPVIGVMDGDLQHDEAVLPRLYRKVAEEGFEIASASRFLAADGAAGLSSAYRLKISDNGIRLANRVFGLTMTDPLTGFFAIRRDAFERAVPHLSELGFKILLDLVTALKPGERLVEVPFKFRPRLHGDSKLDGRVLYDFFLFFIEKTLRPVLPLQARFISFALITGLGLLVHLTVFGSLFYIARIDFSQAQLVATLCVIAFGFSVNNALAYNDRKLRGTDFYLDLGLFMALCSVGVAGNIAVATALYQSYPGVGAIVAALAGALVTVVWNHAVKRARNWARREFRRLSAVGHNAVESRTARGARS